MLNILTSDGWCDLPVLLSRVSQEVDRCRLTVSHIVPPIPPDGISKASNLVAACPCRQNSQVPLPLGVRFHHCFPARPSCSRSVPCHHPCRRGPFPTHQPSLCPSHLASCSSHSQGRRALPLLSLMSPALANLDLPPLTLQGSLLRPACP
jgi:hypothetical protein